MMIKNSTLAFLDKEKTKYEDKLRFFPDGRYKMSIEPYDERKEAEMLRTQAQNRYYHKLLDIICDHTGDDHLDMHDKLKIKFLGRPYVLDDKEYIIVPSTTTLTSKNFGEYIEKVFLFSAEEYGLVLPNPSDYY